MNSLTARNIAKRLHVLEQWVQRLILDRDALRDRCAMLETELRDLRAQKRLRPRTLRVDTYDDEPDIEDLLDVNLDEQDTKLSEDAWPSLSGAPPRRPGGR